MKLNRALLCVGACVSALSALPASAATIEVVSGTRGATIASFDPIGQSFTAVDTGISSFGFQFQGLNTSQPNTALTFTLYAGEDTGGTALATTSFTVPDAAVSTRTPTWYDINLSSFGLNLTPGQLYTGALTATSTRAAVTFGPDFNIFTGVPLSGDAYAGGRLLAASDPDANSYCTRSGNCDLNFRVIGTSAAAVPEPAAWAMLIAGFGAVGRAMRRRPRQLAAV